MAIYIMSTRLATERGSEGKRVHPFGEETVQRIRQACPGVEWQASYAVGGPADYVDVFSAPALATASNVARIVGTEIDAITEVWPEVHWNRFIGLVRYVRAGNFVQSPWGTAWQTSNAQ